MKNFNAKIKELREDEECGGICDSADVLNQFIKFNDNEEPPDNLALGRSTWTLLHSMAANYPENPTDERQLLTQNFFNILAKIYPCKYCAVDFDENLQKVRKKRKSFKENNHSFLQTIISLIKKLILVFLLHKCFQQLKFFQPLKFFSF